MISAYNDLNIQVKLKSIKYVVIKVTNNKKSNLQIIYTVHGGRHEKTEKYYEKIKCVLNTDKHRHNKIIVS